MKGTVVGEPYSLRSRLELDAVNQFQLLENGEEYFPAVLAAIASARCEIIIETFILFDDTVGRQLQQALVDAAARGVSVDLTVDGYGSPDLSDAFIATLTSAGARLHVYDPWPRIFGIRVNIFRRLHRKIVAVDGILAFIGGINFSADQLLSNGDRAKQDYAVRIAGPLARKVHDFAMLQVRSADKRRTWWTALRAGLWTRTVRDDHRAQLVVRDNDEHRDDIERAYREGIRTARREVIIANAYFFPGYKLLRQLKVAARRGVSVKLILQGAPDMPQARTWATMLYPSLLEAGVQIHEYCQRPLHAKVAVIDDEWTTIGSSNLDPLSLALNLEANIVVNDKTLNRQVRGRLEPLLRKHCRQIDASSVKRGGLWSLLCNLAAYHATRNFPRWAGWVPAHVPTIQSITPQNPRTPGRASSRSSG